ncbi:nucleotidyltransferase substrate binding protein [uncultured Sphingomonas sp.]|uniref:nucleotidyltransferase substrate binding protein n=1 Tax=uncultured Sphingomonas sp. TaxID=158754 RepID=UPI0035CB1E99
MSGEEEQELLGEYLATCARLETGFSETCTYVARILPISADLIDTLPVSEETFILSFIKRFEQFEDALHRTLKVISKIMEHGKIERLTSVDVTRRARALGIIADERVWADAVRARNALAHEYPLNPQKRADQVNDAWEKRDTLTSTWSAIRRFVDEEGLLA